MPMPMQNIDEVRRNEAFLSMRAAQRTAERNGQTYMGSAPKAQGSRRQKIITGIAVAAVATALVLLSAFHVI